MWHRGKASPASQWTRAAAKMATKRVVDFCGTSKLYIVRSDLGLYLESSDFEKGTDAIVRILHPDCSGGDHYLSRVYSPFFGTDYPWFVIITGDHFRRVTDLSTAADMTADTRLHEKCRGGDFYLATSSFRSGARSPSFIIVFADDGMYRVVSDLGTAKDAREYKLHDACKGGLYYWATESYWAGRVWHYLVKQEGGELRFHYTKDLGTNEGGATQAFHPSVMNFLTMTHDKATDNTPG